ncbi:hypothetical protein [Bosea beijingensis]|uniref:hypothetical protein n=1 Tax=Bosea beijingensis TaxID=3068632 RepID=UPI002741509C|nr:hypothetical protein [Bosea sp. REN20]
MLFIPRFIANKISLPTLMLMLGFVFGAGAHDYRWRLPLINISPAELQNSVTTSMRSAQTYIQIARRGLDGSALRF